MMNSVRMLWGVTLCLAVSSLVLHTGTATTPSNSLVSMLQGGTTEFFTETTPEPTTEKPYDPFRFLLLCAPGSDRRNTCEKCTKVTRDPKTYKMCCENNKGVRHWCRTFLDYTVPPRVVGIN